MGFCYKAPPNEWACSDQPISPLFRSKLKEREQERKKEKKDGMSEARRIPSLTWANVEGARARAQMEQKGPALDRPTTR